MDPARKERTPTLPTKRSEVPKPGYTTTTPLYPAVSDLWVTLGAQDTKVDLGEVALRLFERTMKSKDDAVSFVNAACTQVGVNSSFGVPWDEVRRNGHHFVIAQTMSIADAFFRRLGREYRAFGKIDPINWKTQKGNEQLDALSALVENLPKDKAKTASKCPEFSLIQYYRAVRNRVIHRSSRDTDATLRQLLTSSQVHFEQNYDIVPKPFANIAYSDFQLLTRAIKYYSRILNQVGDLTPELILQYHLSRSFRDDLSEEVTGPSARNLPWLEALRRLKGKPKRVSGCVGTFKTYYQMSNEDASRFEGALISFLSTDDSAKVRRRIKQRGKD